jgi:Arc/MetJ family transcription regulator
VSNGLQSGKGDIFEGFLLSYYMRRKSQINVSLSDEVIEEVEKRRGLVKRSTYCESLIRSALGMEPRRHPRGSGVDGGLRRLHSRLSYREAGAAAERRLLRLRMGPGWLDQGQRMLWVSRCRSGPLLASILLY